MFKRSIPLIASENVTSPAVKQALTSDFGHRYAEGLIGERLYAGCSHIDQVEFWAVQASKSVFNAEFADVRPISGVLANLVMFTAFTDPGDRIMALSTTNGGHISHGKRKNGGTAGAVHGLKVQSWKFNKEEYNIDVDASIKKIRQLEEQGNHIDLYMFGGSLFLFPHPVKELADVAAEYGSKINYDGAHVAGLIGAGLFQDPLREGADSMTLSTHKTFFGPQRGMVVSFNRHKEALARAAFPGLLSSHHLNTMAALGIALCEFQEYGEAYSEMVVRNAKALAEAMHERGFDVVAEAQGFTESHQVVVDVTGTPMKNGMTVEKELEKAEIIINRNLLPGDGKAGRNYKEPGGIRLGTSELTRYGMKEGDMEDVAEMMKLVVLDGKDPARLRGEVNEFRKDFQAVQYCFPE